MDHACLSKKGKGVGGVACASLRSIGSAVNIFDLLLAPTGLGLLKASCIKSHVGSGLNESLHWGLGYGLGAFLGGFAYEEMGAVAMFLASATLSVVMMVVCVVWEIADRTQKREDAVVRERAGSEANSLVGVAEANPGAL